MWEEGDFRLPFSRRWTVYADAPLEILTRTDARCVSKQDGCIAYRLAFVYVHVGIFLYLYFRLPFSRWRLITQTEDSTHCLYIFETFFETSGSNSLRFGSPFVAWNEMPADRYRQLADFKIASRVPSTPPPPPPLRVIALRFGLKFVGKSPFRLSLCVGENNPVRRPMSVAMPVKR